MELCRRSWNSSSWPCSCSSLQPFAASRSADRDQRSIATVVELTTDTHSLFHFLSSWWLTTKRKVERLRSV
jgi:hypothetical protein